MSVYPAALPTVRPAVRSAFEQGSGGGAASIIAGLFAQGQQGFWLPFTDFASLSQDSAGTLPYTALEQPVGRVLDRSGRGNHATQPTSTARGAVSAMVNWLAKSEALSVSPWSGFGGVVVSDGASSSTLTFGAGVGGVSQSVQGFPPASNLGATFTLKLIANTSSRVLFWGGASAAGTDVVSITPLGGGEWLQTVARTFTSVVGGNPQFQINSSVVGNGAVVIVRACSFVLPQQAATPYQRVNTPTDYDSVGFPKYLRLDGTDDFYTCGGGGYSTGFYYSDVVRPMGGAGTRRVIWSDRSGNNGYELAINTANKLEFSAGNGIAITTVETTQLAAVAEGKQYEVMDDGTNLSVRIDGSAPVTVARPVVAAGSSTITLYRGASTGYFKGQITEPIYRAGPPPTAYERGVIRTYQMQKAGL